MAHQRKRFFNSITVRYLGITTAILVAVELALLGIYTRVETVEHLDHLEEKIESRFNF